MHQGLISGNSDNSFSQLENLEALDVSDTDMGNAEVQQLQALSNLRSLNLTWTKVTRPPLVSSLTSLEMGNVEVQLPPHLVHQLHSSHCRPLPGYAALALSKSCWAPLTRIGTHVRCKVNPEWQLTSFKGPSANNYVAQVVPTPEDLDWLEDNSLLLHLESLRMPGSLLSQQGEAFVRTLLQCSLSHLTSLDMRQLTANSSADFLEGLSQHNSLHTLNISGGLCNM